MNLTQTISISRLLLFAFLTTLLLPLSSCSPRLFMSQDSLDSFMSLKDRTTNLMQLATGDFSDHAADVASFKRDMNDQIQEEADRGDKNSKTVEMLQLLMNPSSNLVGGFLQRWEEKGSLSQAFVDQAVPLVTDNWQKIINLEQSKPRPSLSM